MKLFYKEHIYLPLSISGLLPVSVSNRNKMAGRGYLFSICNRLYLTKLNFFMNGLWDRASPSDFWRWRVNTKIQPH
jgi:hypothetical protein